VFGAYVRWDFGLITPGAAFVCHTKTKWCILWYPGTRSREKHVSRRWLWRVVRVAFLSRGRAFSALPRARARPAARRARLESAWPQRQTVTECFLYLLKLMHLLLHEHSYKRVFPLRAPERRERQFPERRDERDSRGHRSHYWRFSFILCNYFYICVNKVLWMTSSLNKSFKNNTSAECLAWMFDS